MKTLEELQVGKWYQDSNWSSKQDYVKYERVDIRVDCCKIWYGENILNGRYTKRDNFWFFTISTLREVPLEEIQQYLPDGHPDKIINPIFKKGDLVRVLKQSHGWGLIKPGDVGRVDRIDDKCLYVKFEKNSYNWTGTFECFELISEESSTKELTELPEKWMVKVTVENAIILGEFYGKHCYDGYRKSVPNEYVGKYLSSHNLASGDSMFSKSPGSNYTASEVLRGYTEISFETFEKHVLNKESKSIKTEESDKEVWIPKVGDWVVVKSYSQGGQGNGISKDNLISKLYTPGTMNASGMLLKESSFSVKHNDRFYNILKSHIIRKAEPWEIPIEEQTTEIPMVDSSISDFYTIDNYGVGPIIYPHFNYREGEDLATITKPKTPKESFKLNKLPTKSWY